MSGENEPKRKRGLYFDYRLRCLINVSSAVADEIVNNYCYTNEMDDDIHYDQRAVMLGVRGKIPICSFEGGINVRTHIVNRCLYDPELSTERDGSSNWVVTHCNVRYYPRFANNIPKPQKAVQTWDAQMMRQLWKRRKWNYPDVMSINELIEKYPKFEDDYNPWDYHLDDFYEDNTPDDVQDDGEDEVDLNTENPHESIGESLWSMGQRYE